MDDASVKIRVLHLVDTLEVGGLERVVARLANGLDKNNYYVEVCCIASGGAIADELMAQGIKVHILGIREYGKWKNIRKLSELLKELDLHVVHMHGAFAHKIGVIASVIARIPVKISHIHTTYYNLSAKNTWIDKYFRKFVDRVIYISEGCRNSFKNAGYGKERNSVVIYNGVKIPEFLDAAEDDDSLICAVVASLSAHKGHKYLLRAIHQIKDYDSHFKLWIIGDGPMRGELEGLVQDLEINEQVEFLGVRFDIGHLLSEADIFILPSTREGMSLALAEAMAYGKAIIASNVGGIPELIRDKESGLLIKPASAEDIVEKVRSLMYDRQKCKDLGRQARLDCENRFDLNIMVNRIEKLYEQCLKEKR